MRLTKTRIKGFKSIRDDLEIDIDRKITVFLGANDHGKSNILDALLHINRKQAFNSENDLNWDLAEEHQSLPVVECTFQLTAAERQKLQSAITVNHTINKLWENLIELKERILEERAAIASEGSDPTADEDTQLTWSNDREEEDADYLTSVEKTYLNTAVDLSRIYFGIEPSPENSRSDFLTKLKDKKKFYDDLQAKAALAHAKISELKKAIEQANAAGNKQVIEAHNKSIANLNNDIAPAKRASENDGDLYTAINFILENEDSIDAWRSPCAAEIDAPEVPEDVVITRVGVKGNVFIKCSPELDALGFQDEISSMVPSVELIKFSDGITDAVTLNDINSDQKEFMRGIFYYAGLEKHEWNDIFSQNDRTERRLNDASIKLNETLRKNWSQGDNLKFSLSHVSSEGSVKLSIQDPAIRGRYVRASQRSTGFTNFFLLKTILNARKQESEAASFIWLFDEPGVYLHPHGQNDLLQAFETLSETNQIIYCTHSLFMLNKNYPQRHRLVLKSDKGTKIDQKPYRAQWSAAISALGLGLPGTILFASKIVLVEGDSDPIYLGGLLQKAIAEKWTDIDINQLSFIPTGESKNADALIRFLNESVIKPKIVMIFDGDDGGRERAKDLAQIIKTNKIKTYFLRKPAIEYLLYGVETLLMEAVCQYAQKLSGKSLDELRKQAKTSIKNSGKDIEWDKWSRKFGATLAGLDKEISSVGIAREYIQLLEEASPQSLNNGKNEEIDDLISWLVENLNLSTTGLQEELIVSP